MVGPASRTASRLSQTIQNSRRDTSVSLKRLEEEVLLQRTVNIEEKTKEKKAKHEAFLK